MLEAVDALVGDFEVYPSVVDVGHEVVFVNEFLRYHINFDVDVLWLVQRRVEIVVVDIGREELGLWSGTDAVEYPFHHLDGACFGDRVAIVRNGVATDRYAGSIRICFGGAHFADNA